MTVQLHTGSRTVTIGADFLVWDVPCRVVLTDPWQLRRPARCCAGSSPSWTASPARARRAARRTAPSAARRSARAAGPFPYGVTTAPANGTVHHRWPPSAAWRSAAAAAARCASTPRPRWRRSPCSAAPRRWPRPRAAACSSRVGGDLAVSGLAPAGGWRIALPAASDAVPTVLAIDGGALCTVGLPTARPAAQARRHRDGPARRAGVAPPRRARCHRARRERRRLRRAAARCRRRPVAGGVRPRRPSRRRPRRGPGGRLLARPHRHPGRAFLTGSLTADAAPPPRRPPVRA